MKKISIVAMRSLLLPSVLTMLAAQQPMTYEEELATDTAVIVVTGLKVNTEKGHSASEELDVAKGATVRVLGKDGMVGEKKTEAFSRKFYNGQTFYTSDFPVKYGSTYSITITFSNGAVININDFNLDQSWKRHHYFHWTTGYKSPASVLRRQQDEKSGLWCYVYSLFPTRNYIASGGTQVK